MKRHRLPIRLRLTLVFAAGMAVVIGLIAAFVYIRTGADLLDAVDSGLRARAEVLAADIRAQGPVLVDVGASLIERDEAFAQIADPSGRIVHSSPQVAHTVLLDAAAIRALSGTAAIVFDRRVQGIDDVTRVIAVPVEHSGQTWILLVGASLQDRHDALFLLAVTSAIVGPLALILASLAGWVFAGAALRPVERLRAEAAAITASDPDKRLSVSGDRDEVERLGATLNDMLDRLERSLDRERRFLDDASHELRTPVSILKAELDLALRRARSPEELEEALRSAGEEADHLARLTDNLLVLSRARGGRMPLQREEVSLRRVVDEAARHAQAAATLRGIRLEARGDERSVTLDAVRVRQALDNLLRNAIRATPPGGLVYLDATTTDTKATFVVEDSGSGFPEGFLPKAFEPFSRADLSDTEGAGLGLAIVRSVAEAHSGEVRAENRPEGGARVTLELVAGPAQVPPSVLSDSSKQPGATLDPSNEEGAGG